MAPKDKRDDKSRRSKRQNRSGEHNPTRENRRPKDQPDDQQRKQSGKAQDRRRGRGDTSERRWGRPESRQQADRSGDGNKRSEIQLSASGQPDNLPRKRPRQRPGRGQDPDGFDPDQQDTSGSNGPSRRTLLKGLFATSAIGIGAGAAFDNLGGNEEILLEQSSQAFTVKPLSTQKTSAEFYNYSESSDPYDRRDGWGRTFTDIEKKGVSNLFLYQSPKALCLFAIHGRYEVGAGTDPSVWLRFVGLPSYGNWFLRDDSGDYNSMFSEPPHDIRWNWIEGETDGGVFGGLGNDFNIKIEPVSFNYVDSWRFLTGEFPNYSVINLNMNQPIKLRTGTTGIDTGGGGPAEPAPNPPGGSQPAPPSGPSQPAVDIKDVDFQGGCFEVKIVFNEVPAGQFTVQVKVFNAVTGQIEVKTFNLGPGNVGNPLFSHPFLKISLEDIFPSRSVANGDEILGVSFDGANFVDNPNPCAEVPGPGDGQDIIDNVDDIDFGGGCSSVEFTFDNAPTSQFSVDVEVFNTATDQVEVKTFNLGPGNVDDPLFGPPFLEISLEDIFPSRQIVNGDEILAVSIGDSDFVDNPNPCADTPGPDNGGGGGGQNIADKVNDIDFGGGCSDVEISFDQEPSTQFTVDVEVFNTATDQVEIKTFNLGPSNIGNPFFGDPFVEIGLEDIFPSRQVVDGDEILGVSIDGSDFVDNPNPCADTPGPDNGDGGDGGGGNLSSTGRVVFTQTGQNGDFSNLRTVRLGEPVIDSYGVQGAVKGVGPAKGDFDPDDLTEIPATLANGDVVLADANGEVTTLIDSNQDNDSSGARPGTLAVGTFMGQTGIYYAAKNGNISRVKPGNPPVKTTVTTAVSATSIAGIGDIDADGANELVYGGNSPGGSSDTLNYIDQNGSIQGIGVQYGSNNGAGIGSPASFGISNGALIPIIDGDENISLVGPSGVETILVGGEDQTVAKKAPLTSADIDLDGSPEVVFIQPDRSIGFVDDVGGSNTIKTLGDVSGDRVKVKPQTGVR